MTYGEARDAALQLINQYSIAGTEIASSYNNQQDYLNRIPFLVNDAQMYIATAGKRIPAQAVLSDLEVEEFGRFKMYTMPEGFFEFSAFSVLNMDGPEPIRIPFVKVEGRDKFVLPAKGVSDNCIVSYYRYPEINLSADYADAPLDNTLDAQTIVPYYVAAHLVMYDDAYQHAALYNEFETRMARLRSQPTYERSSIIDVYGIRDPYEA